MMGEDASAVLWRSEPAWTRIPTLRAAALAYLAVMSFDRGERDEAASLRRRALRTVQDHHLAWHPVLTGTMLNLTLLGADLEDADFDTSVLATTRALLRGMGHLAPRTRLLAYVLLAEIHLRLDDLDSVRTFVTEAERLAHREPWATGVLERLERVRAQWQERITATRALAGPGPSSITPAERRVLAYLSTHLSMREIGERTNLSPSTIHTQSVSLYRKLGVTNRSDAVKAARELGLTD
jgi:LuxR family maltose regulon positive regulatory protein